jgi:hypothetical protein
MPGSGDITMLLAAYEIGSGDLERIRSFGEIPSPTLHEYVHKFYSSHIRQMRSVART